MMFAQDVLRIYYLYRNAIVLIMSTALFLLLVVGLRRGLNRRAVLCFFFGAGVNAAGALHGFWVRSAVAQGSYVAVVNPMVVVVLVEFFAAASYLLGMGFLVLGQPLHRTTENKAVGALPESKVTV